MESLELTGGKRFGGADSKRCGSLYLVLNAGESPEGMRLAYLCLLLTAGEIHMKLSNLLRSLGPIPNRDSNILFSCMIDLLMDLCCHAPTSNTQYLGGEEHSSSHVGKRDCPLEGGDKLSLTLMFKNSYDSIVYRHGPRHLSNLGFLKCNN